MAEGLWERNWNSTLKYRIEPEILKIKFKTYMHAIPGNKELVRAKIMFHGYEVIHQWKPEIELLQ